MAVVRTHAVGPRDFKPAAWPAGLALAACMPGAALAVDPALPDALTTVNVICSSAARTDASAIGPLPVGLSATCDEHGSSQQGRFGEATWQAVGAAQTAWAARPARSAWPKRAATYQSPTSTRAPASSARR